jgi:hypothetical protein
MADADAIGNTSQNLSCCGQRRWLIHYNTSTGEPFTAWERGRQGTREEKELHGRYKRVDNRHLRLARRLRRCALGWASTPGVSAAVESLLDAQMLEGRHGEGDFLQGKKFRQYSEMVARLETFVLERFPQTWDALRLRRVSHLGSDFSKSLDVLDAEFRATPGMAAAWAAADPSNFDPLVAVLDWSQFVIFKGFTNKLELSFVTYMVSWCCNAPPSTMS